MVKVEVLDEQDNVTEVFTKENGMSDDSGDDDLLVNVLDLIEGSDDDESEGDYSDDDSDNELLSVIDEGDEEEGDASSPIKATSQAKVAARAEQKERARERKKRRVNADVVEAARTAWGADSIKNAPTGERESRVGSVLEQMKGKMSEISVKHDVSRMLQACIKYGNNDQRMHTYLGLKGTMVELSQNQYSYHVVLKLLRYGQKELQNLIIMELDGKCRKLAVHRHGFRVVDLAWRSVCNTEQKNALLHEFYGKEYSLFRAKNETSPSLSTILEGLDDGKSASLLACVRHFLDKCILKGTLQLSLFHCLLKTYLQHVALEQKLSLIELIKEKSLELLMTSDGVGAVCIMLDFASPKQRKLIVKAWKGKALEMALDSEGYLALIKALDVIDDTVLLHKSIITELLEKAVSVALSSSGSKVLLHVLSPRNPRYFTRAELHVLQAAVLPTGEPTSKKSADNRQGELLVHLLPQLISKFATHEALVDSLICDRVCSGVFLETMKRASSLPGPIEDAAKDYMATLMARFTEEDIPDFSMHLLGHPVGHRVIKSLVVDCATIMTAPVIALVQSHVAAVCASRSVWIVVALLERLIAAAPAQAKLLEKLRKSLRVAVKPLPESPGITQLRALLKSK